MATSSLIQQQFIVSSGVALRLIALLVAAASYAGLDSLLSISWSTLIPGASLWQHQLPGFLVPPLFSGMMALILARLSAAKAVSNSLLAAAVVVVLLQIEILQQPLAPAAHHWIHYLHTYSPVFLIIFIFPAVATVWQGRVNGQIKWRDQLAVTHVCLVLCLLTAINIQYRWLAEAEQLDNLTYARIYGIQQSARPCSDPCVQIDVMAGVKPTDK